MKFVYLVEYRQLNKRTNMFELYRTEVYSSKAKANRNVDQSMEINKAYDIDEDKTSYLGENIRRVDYSTIANSDNVEMRLRMVINKVEVR